MAASNRCRHVFLTGPPGVGKTTLIQKVCDRLQKSSVSTQGFYTEEVRSGGRRVGFDVVTLDQQRAPLAKVSDGDPAIGQREYRVGQYKVEVISFEQIALPTLRPKANSSSLVYVIDEIGKMELFSKSFAQHVRVLLNDATATVLATIPVSKGRSLPFVEEIRGRKDAVLFTLTRENRNKLVDEVLSAVQNAIKKS